MICEKCGHEYYGFECPNCAFHKDPAQQENKESEVTESEAAESKAENAAEQETVSGSDIKTSSGVHSDTIHAPEGPQTWNTRQENEPRTPQICPACGAVIRDGAQFCGQCGTPVNPVNGGDSQYTQNQYSANRFTDNYLRERNNDTTGNYHRKVKPGMVILIVVLILLIGIVPSVLGIVFMFRSDEFATEFEAGMNDAFTQMDPDYYDEDPEFYNDPDSDPDPEDLLPEDGTAEHEAVDEGESIYPNGVSIEEYNQLEVGMTYGEISFIIGGDAQKQDLEGAQEGEIIALWPGEYKITAVIRITFVDGVATNIEQSGLF